MYTKTNFQSFKQQFISMSSSPSQPSETSNLLVSCLNVELILIQAEVSSAKKLLQEMARLLTIPLDTEIKEKDVYHCLLEREKLGNTGIGNGVALPHSRCSDATNAIVAIISLKEGVDYDSADRQPVDLAFGLLVPEDANQDHLNLLADIARLMSTPENKRKISAVQSGKEMISTIKNIAK